MEEDKKLYPTRFCTLEDTYSWGSEEFKLADLGYRDSLVRDGWLAGNSLSEMMEMYMDRVTGEDVFSRLGRQFPLTVKNIHVKGKMPLRVHPDDTVASQRYDLLGKEKLWYVVRAGKDASVMLGFLKDSDASELYSRCLDGSVGQMLNTVAVHSGQVIRIAPGTVHAAQGDLDIIEISEASPMDFCLCGWGEEVSTEEFDETLTLVDALDFIDYRRYVAEKSSGESLLNIPQFCVNRLDLKTPLRVHGENSDQFELYTCVSGSAAVQVEVLGQTASFPFGEGETILVPAECPDFILAPTAAGTVLLESLVPHLALKDAYINPDVPAKLEGEEDTE
ncbi:MAG: hypothetical protein KBS67_06220 [Bacteroidales bacterium]|nr:hypothetical protein [Candidatus Cryptobacteroides equifaecalis]